MSPTPIKEKLWQPHIENPSPLLQPEWIIDLRLKLVIIAVGSLERERLEAKNDKLYKTVPTAQKPGSRYL